MHTKTGQTLIFPKKKKKTRRYKHTHTHSHTIAFPSTVQLTRLKKKHKNKLHKYFLPSLFFLPPCFLVSRVVVFFKSGFVLCSAGGFGVVPCPLGFGRASSLELPHTSRSGVNAASKLEGQKGHRVPSQGHPRDHPHSPPPRHRKYQGPLHENIRWDVSPCLPKQLFRGQGQK